MYLITYCVQVPQGMYLSDSTYSTYITCKYCIVPPVPWARIFEKFEKSTWHL